jgi:predicted permease
MSRLRQDLAYARRLFARAPGFSLTAVLVLGVGIGANTAILTVVNELLLRPLSGRTGELYGVYSASRTNPDAYQQFSYPAHVDLRNQREVFDGLIAQTLTMVGTPATDGMRQSLAAVVSSNYFDVLGVRLAAGRGFTAEEERPGARSAVAVVPHRRWAAAGLDPAFVGSTIRLNEMDVTVVGVAPQGFSGTMALVAPEVFLPLGMFESVVNNRFKNNGRGLGDRSNAGLVLAGLLAPAARDAALQPRLEALARQLEAADPVIHKDIRLTASPLARLNAGPAPQSDAAFMTVATFLLGLSATVLVIACLNIANMLLARGSARGRELALRLALGAHRGRVVRQLLTESLLLAAAGSVVGLFVSYWAMATLSATLTAALPFGVAIRPDPDLNVLLATAVLTALATVACGLGPALRLSRRDLIADLRDRATDLAPAGRRFSTRNVLVVGQLALSLAMLTAGGIFAQTVVGAAARTPGYSYDRALVASVDTILAGFDEARGRVAYGTLLSTLRSMPDVEAAAVGSTVPFSENVEGARFERADGSGGEAVRARAHRIIGADYFASFGLRVIRGRDFTRAEESSPAAARVAIVDDELARALFGGADPIGRFIRLAPPADAGQAAPGAPMEIVGVAPPVMEERLDRGPVPHVYVPSGQNFRAGMYLTIRLRPGVDERAALDRVREAVRSAEPQLPILSLSTLRAFHEGDATLWGLRAGAWVFASLGLLALMLAAIGVYGVKAYVVAQRTREIGIRLALGATPTAVVSQLFREGLVLTGVGLAIGAPLAVLVSMSFTAVFVDIGGFDPAVIAVATLVLAASATAATLIPARRATRVHPVTALRTD